MYPKCSAVTVPFSRCGKVRSHAAGDPQKVRCGKVRSRFQFPTPREYHRQEYVLGVRTRSTYSEYVLRVRASSTYWEYVLGVRTRSTYSEYVHGVRTRSTYSEYNAGKKSLALAFWGTARPIKEVQEKSGKLAIPQFLHS